MKTLTLLLSLVFAAGFTFAGEAAKPAADTKAAAKATLNTHEVDAEVVSVDAEKNTITLKTEKGESKAPVEGKAVASLKDLKPGQKVTVVCRDDEKGAHQAVTEIKAPAVKKTEPTK